MFFAAALYSHSASARASDEPSEESAVAAVDHAWGDDLDLARTAAALDGKPILVLFTGSDWCGPCKVLEQSVTETDPFLNGVSELAHLVRLDLPRRPGIVEPMRLEANQQHVETYHITAYPTLLSLGADGRPIAHFEGERTTESLLGFCAVMKLRLGYRDSLLSRAAGLNGDAKRLHIAEALRLISDRTLLMQHYPAEMALVPEFRLAPVTPETVTNDGLDQESLVLAFRDEVAGADDQVVIEKMEAMLKKYPTGVESLRLTALRLGLPSMVREDRVEQAQAVITHQIECGLKVQPNSYLGEIVTGIEGALGGTPKDRETYVTMERNKKSFYEVDNQVSRTADPKKRLELLAPFDELELDPINRQWLLILQGLSLEQMKKLPEARAKFAQARDLPGGGPGNQGYAQEQLDRVGK